MERKIKLGCIAIVMAMVCAGFVGILDFGEAADTPSSVLTNLSLAGGNDVQDVMWAPDGTWGFAVGAGGRFWELSDSTDYTVFTPMVTNVGDSWNAVSWDQTLDVGNGGFWFTGDGSGNGATNVYTYDQTNGVLPANPTPNFPNDVMTGVASHPGQAGDYLVVGNDVATNPVAYYYNGGYSAALTGVGIVANNVFTDVTYTAAAVDNFILTGYNVSNTNTGMTFYATGANLQGGTFTAENMFNTTGANSNLNAVSWNPTAGDDYGLVVGADDRVHMISETGANLTRMMPNFLTTANYAFYDVKFDEAENNPEEALIVGTDSNNGAVLRFVDQGGQRTLYEVTGSPIGGTIAPANCVAYKTYASPRFGVVFGSTWAYQVNNIESGQPITVSTLYPHINALELYSNYGTASNASALNTKVDVDVGMGTEIMTAYVQCNHQDGWGEVDEVNITIWFDDGNVDTNSVTYTNGLPEGTNNTHAIFVYDQTSGLITQTSPGNMEIELLSSSAIYYDGDGENATLWFNFTMNSQVWASIAPNGFVEVAGNPANDQLDVTEALDSPFTWDMQAMITGDSGGDETRWDEFGVYIYQEFSSSGLPGVYTGSGAPGSIIPLTTSGNNYANFSANYNYSFGVYITDDMYGANPANSIDVDNYGSTGTAGNDGLAVVGGDLAQADIDNGFFGRYYVNATGPTGLIYLLGETWDTAPTAGNWVTPNTEGNYTTTGGTGTNHAKDGAASEPIYIQCQVNAVVAEDNYQGTLVYILQHE